MPSRWDFRRFPIDKNAPRTRIATFSILTWRLPIFYLLPKNMKTAILLPTWVGDACMATPTIRAIRNGMSDNSELCLVGRYAPIAVLEGLPSVDSTITYKPKSKDGKTLSRRGMIAELKRRKLDLIILLPNSLSAGIIGFMSGATRRVGYATDGRSWLLTDRIPLIANHRLLHEHSKASWLCIRQLSDAACRYGVRPNPRQGHVRSL